MLIDVSSDEMLQDNTELKLKLWRKIIWRAKMIIIYIYVEKYKEILCRT